VQVDPSVTRVLLTDAPLNSAANRGKALEVLFEVFGFNGVCLQPTPVLSLYSQGLTTGLVVDSGATQTTIVPVLEGYVDVAHMKRLSIAGDAVTGRLRQLVRQKCASYAVATAGDALFERMKERTCYVAVNLERETAVRSKQCSSNQLTNYAGV
jgi:actin-related protein 2